ncbi:hypothetical protein Zmor_011855 [Zophobas morio]|uniref:Uncharacterized protein n=1 Tax=Zophobas morio TaxID=2755281 RepID=A0AA38HLJ0_9CUCU|nr:hypothetical protein Zmor_011855 [Zophobas morio]
MVNHKLPLKKPLSYDGDEISGFSAPKNRGLRQNEAQNAIDTVDYRDELTGDYDDEMPRRKQKQKVNKKELRRQQQQRRARRDDYETYDDMTTQDNFVPQQKRLTKKQMKQQARMERRNIVEVTSD